VRLRAAEVVGHAVDRGAIAGDHRERRARVAVARLAHAADVDDARLLEAELPLLVGRLHEAEVLAMHARPVRVADEARPVDALEDLLHLLRLHEAVALQHGLHYW